MLHARRVRSPASDMKRCTYILPIRRNHFDPGGTEELRDYLASVAATGCEVLVVDGSPPDVFSEHDRLWSELCRHEPVDPRFGYLNDKVNGVHTGVTLATSEKIILADDDIRYARPDIEQMLVLLDEFEVVRPQNYFTLTAPPEGETRWIDRSAVDGNSAAPLSKISNWLGKRVPSWAKMEAARMLINRATLRTADYPGTCAFRRTTMRRAGEYDGDVLFDNEEIIRHFARAGARIYYANDFFIGKRPPKWRKWLEQRPRQAYEDFGLRFKTALFASFLPIGITLAAVDVRCLAVFLLSIPLATAGWLRGTARNYFPFTCCLFAPLWVLERTLSTYWAFYWFLTRGGYPFGDRMLKKGTGRDWLEGGKMASATLRK